MPVVTTTVLAIGAQEMANEKALVNRYYCLSTEQNVLLEFIDSHTTSHYTYRNAAPSISVFEESDTSLHVQAICARGAFWSRDPGF